MSALVGTIVGASIPGIFNLIRYRIEEKKNAEMAIEEQRRRNLIAFSKVNYELSRFFKETKEKVLYDLEGCAFLSSQASLTVKKLEAIDIETMDQESIKLYFLILNLLNDIVYDWSIEQNDIDEFTGKIISTNHHPNSPRMRELASQIEEYHEVFSERLTPEFSLDN